MVLTKRTSNLPLICQICGDVARGINFEVMSCMSCKAFFRRHALQPRNFLRCQLNNNCEITRITRGGCSACRLKKCFSLGMNPKLIRYNPQNQDRRPKRTLCLLPKPSPLNLLQNDTSSLTNADWTLLSNIINAYDSGCIIEQCRHMLEQQTTLPPKLRSKSNITYDLIGFFYSSIQTFVERVPYFQSLPIHARRALVQHNFDMTGTLNSIFIVRETSALDNLAYVTGCCTIYGYENVAALRKYVSQLEQNGIMVKLMLLVTAFAGNCSIVTLDPKENLAIISSTISLIRVQSIFVTILWKYLVYQYGEMGAIRWFNSSIKFILNILRWIDEKYHAAHWNMVDHIVENTARSLTING